MIPRKKFKYILIITSVITAGTGIISIDKILTKWLSFKNLVQNLVNFKNRPKFQKV